jgi:outer membrane protein OmpA-like peptidoglycan-associated protein
MGIFCTARSENSGRTSAVAFAACAMFALTTSACGGPSEVGTCSTGTGAGVVVLTSGTRTDVRASLPPDTLSAVHDFVDAASVTDGPGGRGVPAVISSADGHLQPHVDLAPRLDNCQVDHSPSRAQRLQQNLDRLSRSTSTVTSSSAGLDLLEAESDATAGRTPGLLIQISHGLSTRGALDLRALGWYADPQTLADDLRRGSHLPDLTGWRVIFVAMGDTAGDQPPLTIGARRALESDWMAICRAEGALSCTVDHVRLDDRPTGAQAEMPVVPVPGVVPITAAGAQTGLVLNDDVIGFSGDSASLSADGVAIIGRFAAQVAAQGVVRKRVVITGFCADPPGSTASALAALSRSRADAVSAAFSRALADHTTSLSVETVAGGAAPGTTAMVNGRFDEAIAQTMRRVEIRILPT